MKYKISKKAFEDIDNIWFYTMETWSLQQADKYYKKLKNKEKNNFQII